MKTNARAASRWVPESLRDAERVLRSATLFPIALSALLLPALVIVPLLARRPISWAREEIVRAGEPARTATMHLQITFAEQQAAVEMLSLTGNGAARRRLAAAVAREAQERARLRGYAGRLGSDADLWIDSVEIRATHWNDHNRALLGRPAGAPAEVAATAARQAAFAAIMDATANLDRAISTVISQRRARLETWERRSAALSLIVLLLASLTLGIAIRNGWRLLQHLKLQNELAATDPLTGTQGYDWLRDSVARELYRGARHGGSLAVVCVGVDGLGEINAEFGRATGDLVLRSVATTLRHGLRRTDAVARLGGDRFGVLLADTDAAGAGVATEKLRQWVGQFTERSGVPLTLSVGCATSAGGESSTATQLIARAEALMREVNAAGGDGLRCEASPARVS